MKNTRQYLYVVSINSSKAAAGWSEWINLEVQQEKSRGAITRAGIIFVFAMLYEDGALKLIPLSVYGENLLLP